MNFEALARYQDELTAGPVPGNDIFITVAGREVFRRQSGYADLEGGKKMLGDELYFAWSGTKLVTSSLGMRLVEEGKVLGIFPEGTRSKDPDGKMLPPKAGVALIAKATHSDVLPACIYFEGKSKFRKKITVRFGEVIPYEELGLSDESNMSEIKDASRLVMGKIGELLEKGHEKD